jgi:hypothetical protein
VEALPLYVRSLSFLLVIVYMVSTMFETTGREISGTPRDFDLQKLSLH